MHVLGLHFSIWSFIVFNPHMHVLGLIYSFGFRVNIILWCFSLAAVCIRTDKEREEAMNMQYLMPVYHQKQQAYGPYGYAAYPGPYYGSQYGPY